MGLLWADKSGFAKLPSWEALLRATIKGAQVPYCRIGTNKFGCGNTRRTKSQGPTTHQGDKNASLLGHIVAFNATARILNLGVGVEMLKYRLHRPNNGFWNPAEGSPDLAHKIAHSLFDPGSAEAQPGGFANDDVQIGRVLRAAPRETDAKNLRIAAPATRNVAGLGLVLSHS